MHYGTMDRIGNTYAVLRDNGINITPKANTPLGELVKLATPAIVVGNSAGHSPTGSGHLYEVCNSDSTEQTQYDIALDTYVRDISGYVKKHLGFFRNVVHPNILEYMEKMNAGWSSYIPKQPGSDFEIIQLEGPTALYEGNLPRITKDYEGNTQMIPPKQSLMLGQKTKEELLELCSTGNEEIDASLVNWFSNNQYLEMSYALFFADLEKVSFNDYTMINLTGGNWRTDTFQHAALLALNPFDRLGIVLPAFIIASHLYSAEVDDSAENMTVSSYREIASQIRDYTGAICAMTFSAIETTEKQGNIVLDFKGSSVVRVYGRNYKLWLSEGGSVEAMYGLILSPMKYYSKDMLDQHKERLEQMWNNHLAIFTTHEQQKSYIVFKELLRSTFLQMLDELSEIEKGVLERDPNYISRAVAILNDELEYVSTRDMMDIYSVCMTIMTKARYYYTDSYQFFKTAHTATLTNPNIKDPREATLIATLDYVVTYVLDQATIVK